MKREAARPSELGASVTEVPYEAAVSLGSALASRQGPSLATEVSLVAKSPGSTSFQA